MNEGINEVYNAHIEAARWLINYNDGQEFVREAKNELQRADDKLREINRANAVELDELYDRLVASDRRVGELERDLELAHRDCDAAMPAELALHNVQIVGDAHGAVLALLEAWDELRAAQAANKNGGAQWHRVMEADRAMHAARARFHIPSTTQRDNADESEVRA